MKYKSLRCNNQAGKYKHCPVCREKIRLKSAEFRAGLRPIEHECEEEGCTTMVPANRHFCDPCRDNRIKISKRAANENRYPETRKKTVTVAATKKVAQSYQSEDDRLAEMRSRLDPVLYQQRLLRGCIVGVLP